MRKTSQDRINPVSYTRKTMGGRITRHNIFRNNTSNSSLKFSPFEIVYGTRPKFLLSLQALKSKQFEMGSQIRRQGPILSAILFKAFPYFQCFRILSNAANFCKTLLDKFHVRQVWQLGWWIPSGTNVPPAEVSTQWFQNTKLPMLNKYGKFRYAISK